jgi:hypothetical protein
VVEGALKVARNDPDVFRHLVEGVEKIRIEKKRAKRGRRNTR